MVSQTHSDPLKVIPKPVLVLNLIDERRKGREYWLVLEVNTVGSSDDPLVGYQSSSTEMRFVNPHRDLEIFGEFFYGIFTNSILYLPGVLIDIRLIAVQNSPFLQAWSSKGGNPDLGEVQSLLGEAGSEYLCTNITNIIISEVSITRAISRHKVTNDLFSFVT